MNLNSVLMMLLGAALVSVGVLANALADRIRGLKQVREPEAREPRERTRRQSAPAPVIPVVEAAELLRPAPPAPAKPRTRPEPKPVIQTDGGEDVIAALVASGYKRPIATEATWACSAPERATVEGWTAAALRRCARGGMS